MARVVLYLFLALFVSAQAFMVLPNGRMVSMIFESLLFFQDDSLEISLSHNFVV
jgi:hypothetical protein